MTTADLVEWLSSFTRKASNHQRGSNPKNSLAIFIYRGNRFSVFFPVIVVVLVMCVCACVCVCVYFMKVLCI